MPFNLFSKRGKVAESNLPFQYNDVPSDLRVQIWYILDKTFGTNYVEPGAWSGSTNTVPNVAWSLLQKILMEELGVFNLARNHVNSIKQDCFQFFINEASAPDALDFTDLGFRIADTYVRKCSGYHRELGGVELEPDAAVAQLNYRFDQHRLGFQFTDGQLMRRDSEFAHAEITEPAARLLSLTDGFKGPHQEFLKAHKAYREQNSKEAIREALNAFESTLKAICTLRKWKFDTQRDTSSRLLSIVFEKHLIPDYLSAQFNALRSTLEAGVPTLRNRAAGHGQGPEPLEVPMYLAAYALHMSGSAILLLVAAHQSSA